MITTPYKHLQLRKLNILKENLQQKSSLTEANLWRNVERECLNLFSNFQQIFIQENERLTEVGIGLHMQGRVIYRLLRERFNTRMDQLDEVFDGEAAFFIGGDKLDMLKREAVRGEMEEQKVDNWNLMNNC